MACPSLERAPEAQSAPEPLPGGEFDLSVIVPVYEDEEATARCLDTLEAQNLPGLRWRIVVVNDASPNAALVADVARRAAEGRLTLIHLATNVGYAAAVNRAAGAIRSGALLLLNADTLLPEGALERLMAIASQTPDLGTLTPLSNDGVVTSFPLPYTRNDLPSPEDLARWDAAAKAADHGPVAIPNGIGFCLLVTRACWDAVGGLPLTYGRGYFEDVELCLTARTLGFRNLCAMNVMVGHVGSRSFGASKRRLVMKNSAIFAARFPSIKPRSMPSSWRSHSGRASPRSNAGSRPHPTISWSSIPCRPPCRPSPYSSRARRRRDDVSFSSSPTSGRHPSPCACADTAAACRNPCPLC